MKTKSILLLSVLSAFICRQFGFLIKHHCDSAKQENVHNLIEVVETEPEETKEPNYPKKRPLSRVSSFICKQRYGRLIKVEDTKSIIPLCSQRTTRTSI